MTVSTNDDGSLNAMLPSPYGMHEYPNKGSVVYTDKHGKKRKISKKFGKYRPALKTLLPIRNSTSGPGMIPVENIGCFSTIFFSWISPLMWKGYRSGLDASDVYKCPPTDGSFTNGARLANLWQEELKSKGPEKASLVRVLFRFLRTRILIQCFLFSVVIVLGVLAPAYFMMNLLKFIEKEANHGMGVGIAWALGLTAVEIIRTTLMTGLWSIALRSATRLRSASMHLLYTKIFKMAVTEEKSIGQMVNIFGNDAATLYDAPLFIPLIIGGPLMIIAGIIFVYAILGPVSLIGMSVFLIFFPIQAVISKMIGKFRRKMLKVKDTRSSKMTELLTCIKLIKLYAWEDIFQKQITDVRNQERKYLQKGQFLQSMSLSLAPSVPILAAFVTFVVHIAVGGELSSAQAFTTLTLFYIIGMAVRTLPHEIRTVIHTKISIDRIKKVLVMSEMEPYVQKLSINCNDAVTVKNASFTWDFGKRGSDLVLWQRGSLTDSIERSDDPMLFSKNLPEIECGYHEPMNTLNNINVNVGKGSLVAVVGRTGSGKTSLLSAILGNMSILRGEVAVGGTCAYVSQQPWIMNGTLRENVLLGQEFEPKWYYQVLHSCELTEDISRLPGGDNTQVGERGVRLSGGQRLRVCLARSIYSKRDVYLLDDCFSGIDPNVAMKIFNKVISNMLSKKTVIMVTHNVQLLEYCNEVVVLKSGRITDVGTHHNLLQTSDSYTSLIEAYENLQNKDTQEESTTQENFVSSSKNVENEDTCDSDNCSEDSDGCIEPISAEAEEKVEKGYISTYIFKKYIEKAGGYIVSFTVLLTMALNIGCGTFSSWWLSEWLRAGSGPLNASSNETHHTSSHIGENPNLGYYQAVYGITVGFVIITNIIRAIIFTKATLSASTGIHNDLFLKVLASPMKFFDCTPIGRTLNLFTKDQEVVDCRLPLRIEILLQYFFIVSFALIVLIAIIPWMFVAITIFAILFFFVHKVFHHSVRDIKRLQNVSWPAIFSHVATSMHGLDSIKVYNRQDSFIEKFDRLYDQCSAPLYLYNSANRWIGIRLELIAITITMITSILTVVLRNRISPSYAGLALSYTIQFCTYFQYMVRTMNQTEADFTSFERQLSYTESLQSESEVLSAQSSKEKSKEANGPDDSSRAGWRLWTESWPTRGRVSFQNVSMRYQPCLLPVLNSVTFDVYPGEKVGIVGRTGAGKSSLGVVLFRLVEISSGLIYIDGVDISTLPLRHLRSRLCIIPQDPVLFHGTIRHNLDPNDFYSDDQLWEALSKASLKSKIVSLSGHLTAVVNENGRNFSVGERQLLCLARAILRSSKVILLDEATASIDMETESKIQRILQECFKKSTVLTIAHRLQTVKDSDRILVMDNGSVAEFDKPANLLENPNSRFSSMVAAGTFENS